MVRRESALDASGEFHIRPVELHSAQLHQVRMHGFFQGSDGNQVRLGRSCFISTLVSVISAAPSAIFPEDAVVARLGDLPRQSSANALRLRRNAASRAVDVPKSISGLNVPPCRDCMARTVCWWAQNLSAAKSTRRPAPVAIPWSPQTCFRVTVSTTTLNILQDQKPNRRSLWRQSEMHFWRAPGAQVMSAGGTSNAYCLPSDACIPMPDWIRHP
ncbi:hypothetical protein ABIC07_009464 [Bradyrhizobium sp. RT9a]